MPDSFLRQSALAHLALDGRAVDTGGSQGMAPGVAMKELPFKSIINLRGDPKDTAFLAATSKTLGFDLPLQPNQSASKDQITALWLAPDEWWIITDSQTGKLASKLEAALSGQHISLVDVGESRTTIRVTGRHARDQLAKGTPLDLHPTQLPAGRCAGTHIAKAIVVLHYLGDSKSGEPTYDIYVLRSFADYLWRWLEDAAQEYGFQVRP